MRISAAPHRAFLFAVSMATPAPLLAQTSPGTAMPSIQNALPAPALVNIQNTISNAELQMSPVLAVRPAAPVPNGQLQDYSLVRGQGAATIGTIPSWSTTPAGPVHDYSTVKVEGDASAKLFYYIRQDHYLTLVGPNDDPTLLMAYNTFGPHPVGSGVNARVGSNYLFLPICGNRLSASHEFLAKADAQGGQVTISCLH